MPDTSANASLAAALVDAVNSIGDITKSRTADTGKYQYTYADLSDILAAAKTILHKHGLAAVQNVESTANGGVAVSTVLIHQSGETMTFGALVLPGGNTPQAVGSAITYARRYSLLAALGVATEDDDGQAAAAAFRSKPKITGQRATPRDTSPPTSDHGDPVDPNAISKAQLGMLNALLPSAGIVDRDDKHQWVNARINRTITSSKELTKREASKLIDELKTLIEADDRDAALADEYDTRTGAP